MVAVVRFNAMTLIEYIEQLSSADDTHVIYASPRWRPESAIHVGPEPFDGSVPSPAEGMTYLVSVPEAKRVLRSRPMGTSARDAARAIVYYGIYDCAEPIAVAV